MEDIESIKEFKPRLTFANAPDVMDKYEVAELLHVAPQTIYNLSNRKELKCIYILGARRFTKRSVCKFIYDQTGDEMYNPDNYKNGDASFLERNKENNNLDMEASL